MRKLIVAMIMVLAAFTHAGDSAPFVLDNATSPSGESVILPWNAEWIGGKVNATVVITDNGTEVKRATGSGEFTLNTSCGNHQLEYSTFINGVKQVETYTAKAELAHITVETKAVKAATCTESGWTRESKCSRCNAVLEASSVIPALGHTRQTTVAAIEPTCTTDGRTAEVKCSRCGIVLEESVVLLGGHVGAVTKPAVEATSNTDGMTAEITCTRCGTVLQEQTTVPALGYVRNVTARQIWPHKKVEICYELADEIREVESATLLPFVACRYGSTVKTASTILGDASSTPGLHRIVWDMEADRLAIDQSDVVFTVDYSTSGQMQPGNSVVPGFVTRTFATSSSAPFDVTSDIWNGGPDVVAAAEKIYASTLSTYTTVAYGCYMQMTKGVQYNFKCCYDDYAVVAVDGQLLMDEWPGCAEVTGSFTPQSTGWHQLEFRVGNAGGPGGLYYSYEYGILWNTSLDSTWRRVENSEGEVLFFTSNFDNSSVVHGEAKGVTINTSDGVVDGMSVGGMVNLGYSPFVDGEVKVLIDGAVVLSTTNSGSFAWKPLAMGSHTVKHISGEYEWTRQVNVTELAYDLPPTPNPPTPEDAGISIGSTSKAFAAGGGSGSITTSGSGAWTATASDSWITIPSAMASRNAGLPVVYQVAATTEVESRTGYIYVSGHVFTVTQAGVGAALAGQAPYQADFEMDGGSGSFTVLADAQTEWKVRSNVDWISVCVEGTGNGEWGTVGSGEQSVLYTVAPYDEIATRSGTITAAGCTFTVNQTGRRMKLVVAEPGGTEGAGRPPCLVERDYLSHVVSVTVNALASTEWDVGVESSWLAVVDAGSGHGGGSVTIAVNENPSWLERRGTVRIGTETLTIRQFGRPADALYFSITPEATTASVKGANGIISVMATPDMPWSAQSRANWLTVVPAFQSGAGNGNVVYTASPNPTMASRTGTITVTNVEGGVATHSVEQPAATAMISADGHVFDAAGESFGVAVTTDDIVSWTIFEDVDWISVDGSLERIGSGTVTLAATENLTVDSREAHVMIAGHSFSVRQKGRTLEVEYESRVFGTETDYDSIDVHPDGNVQWTASSSDPSWLTIWGDDGCTYDADGNVIGSGDHTIEYIVADYVGDGTPRIGTITIGDKTIYITQRPYDLSINPASAMVSGNAGTGEVGVPASVGQIWNAIATEPWITVTRGYDGGTGSGTVLYSYEDNDTGETRTGRIIIAGEAYTITQAARQMVTIGVTTRVVTGNGEPGTGNGGVVSGGGTYDRGTTVSLTAVANDGYSFVNWTMPNGSVVTSATLPVTADVDKEIVASFRRIPVYSVNGESVREGTSKTFTAPADVIDAVGTTKLVCRGTSRYPDKGTSFTLVVTEDIDFEWDLWTTNYLVSISAEGQGNVVGARVPACPSSIWAAAGETVELTAVPNGGQSFLRWTGDVAGGVDGHAGRVTLPLVADGPKSVAAKFGMFSDTLATALDAPALTFTTGGDAVWLPVIDATAQTGYTSARSGTIGAESETWLDTTVEGAGTLTFRWRVDCEKDDGGGATWDRLSVWTNGVEVARIDGKKDWQTVTLPISGKTTVRWSFYRDDWDESGQAHESCGWVDGIVFTAKEGE